MINKLTYFQLENLLYQIHETKFNLETDILVFYIPSISNVFLVDLQNQKSVNRRNELITQCKFKIQYNHLISV